MKDIGPFLFTRANFCPVPQGLLNQDCRIANSEDSPAASSLTSIIPTYGAKRGENSKCFNYSRLSPGGWVDDGICLETKCNAEKRVLEVYIDSNVVECRNDFETHDIPGYFGGKFECPRLAVACPM